MTPGAVGGTRDTAVTISSFLLFSHRSGACRLDFAASHPAAAAALPALRLRILPCQASQSPAPPPPAQLSSVRARPVRQRGEVRGE